MKRIRSMTIILAAAAMALIVAAGVGPAIAYFTTYAEAEGGRVVNFSHREEIEENVTDFTKQITIKNQKGSQPVYIRAKAYTGAEYTVTYSGAGWTAGAEGWWYYENPVGSEESTAPLTATLNGISEADLEDGSEVNMAVVFESALVIYEYNESTKSYESVADWSKIFDSGNSQV